VAINYSVNDAVVDCLNDLDNYSATQRFSATKMVSVMFYVLYLFDHHQFPLIPGQSPIILCVCFDDIERDMMHSEMKSTLEDNHPNTLFYTVIQAENLVVSNTVGLPLIHFVTTNDLLLNGTKVGYVRKILFTTQSFNQFSKSFTDLIRYVRSALYSCDYKLHIHGIPDNRKQ